MTCGLNEAELRILYKIAYMNRWCPKHISQEDLMKGVPRSSWGELRKAIESLLKKGYLRPYHSQGRDDVCVNKSKRNDIIKALKAHEHEYSFIKYIEFIR